MTANPSKSENRFPNCLRMELEIEPINNDSFDLVANIRFGEHKIPLKRYGEAIFGLKKGKLKIDLTNGKVPLKNIKLKKEFQTDIEIKVQEEKEKEQQGGVNVGWKQGVNVGSKKTAKEGQEYNYRDYQVKTEGEEKDPCWVFEAKYGEILEGLLSDTKLAMVDMEEKPCSLIVTFKVENTEDICLTKGSFLWRKNITKKKMAILERFAVKRLIDELVQEKPYLSRVDLAHG